MASGGGFVCPICITEIDPAVNRWVQESCGHRICRNCFMESEDGCTQCKKLGASFGIDANRTLGDGPKKLKTIIAKRGKERNPSRGKPPFLLPIGIASSGSSNESVTFASTVGVVQGALYQGKVKRSRRKSAGNLNRVWQEELCKSTGKNFATVKKRPGKTLPAASAQKNTGEHQDGGIYAFTEDNLSENDDADEEDDEKIEEYQQGGLGKKKIVAFESTNGNDGNMYSSSWDNTSVSDREGPRPPKLSSQLPLASAEHAITTEEGPGHAGPILMSFANRGKKSLLDRSRNDSESRSRSASFSDSSSDASIEVDRLALDNPTESNSDFSMSYIDTSNSKSSKPNKSEKRQRHPISVADHINVIPGNDSGTPTSYECTVCYKKFKTKAHIKYHDFCGNKEKPFKCEECGQGFIAKSHYEYHLRTHTGERPYVCKLCGRGFNQRGKVTRHMRSHTGEKPFICQQCGRGFANAQALRSHSLIHSGERPFACQFCNKRFTGMTNLKKHVITHTGERPYTCNHCGKSFGLKWTLDLHLRTHSTERPYACDQCTRAFSNSKDLRRHLVIHTGERPFKCWICGTAFRRKDNLDRHIKNTHNQPKEIAKQLANEAAADYQQKQQQQREAQARLGSGSVIPETRKNRPNILKSKTKSSNHGLSDGEHRSTKECRRDVGQEPLRADSAMQNEITIPLDSDLSSEQMTVEQMQVAAEPQTTRRVQFQSQSPAKPRSVSGAELELPTMQLTTGSYSPVLSSLFRHSTPSTVPGGFETYAIVPGTSAEASTTSSVLVPRCVSETVVNRASNIRPTANIPNAHAFISHVVLPPPPIPRQKVIEVANFDNGTTEVTIREEIIKMEAADVMEEHEIRQQDPFLSQAVPPPTYFLMNASDCQHQSLLEDSQESDTLSPPIMRVNAGTMTESTEFENTPEPETTQEFGVQTGDCFSSQFNSDLLHDTKPFPRRQDVVNHVTATSQTELSTMPEQIENFQNGSNSPGNGSKEFAYFLESESRVEPRQSVDAPKIVSYCSVNLHHDTGEISREGKEFGSVSETVNQATGNIEVRSSSSTAILNDVGFTETGFEDVDEDSEERSRRPGYYRGARLFDIDLDSILPRSIP